jgi:molybdopterin-guanine dinucleotide biosynthesis protein A
VSAPAPSSVVLGAIIAGGASTRFGSPKALAEIDGRRIIDRVADALRTACTDVIAIMNDTELARLAGLPHRTDVLSGAGALAGIHAALLWARERNCAGVIAAGCDMPFLSPSLMHGILARTDGHDVVIPGSDGPRGVEPLCAFYATSCIQPIEDAVARGDARMIGFHDAVTVHRMPIEDVRAFGDPMSCS